MSTVCDRLLDLRNRIAHHEPIFHLPLDERRKELAEQIGALCAANAAYAEHACTFEAQWPPCQTNYPPGSGLLPGGTST